MLVVGQFPRIVPLDDDPSQEARAVSGTPMVQFVVYHPLKYLPPRPAGYQIPIDLEYQIHKKHIH
jgi:hypothetical protein